MTMMATLDGSLCYILHINDRVYKRLHVLQNHLLHHVAHYAGWWGVGVTLFRLDGVNY